MKVTRLFLKKFFVISMFFLYGCFGGSDEQQEIEEIISNEVELNEESNEEYENNENMDLNVDQENEDNLNLDINNNEENNDNLNENLGDISENNNDNSYQNLNLDNATNNIPTFDNQEENSAYEAEGNNLNDSFNLNPVQNFDTTEVNEDVPATNDPYEQNSLEFNATKDTEQSVYYLVREAFSFKDTSGQAPNAKYEKGDKVVISNIENDWAKISENNYISINDITKDPIPRNRDENPFQ